MTNHFVHLEYSTTHAGVVRAEQAVQNVRDLSHGITAPRALAAAMLPCCAFFPVSRFVFWSALGV